MQLWQHQLLSLPLPISLSLFDRQHNKGKPALVPPVVSFVRFVDPVVLFATKEILFYILIIRQTQLQIKF